MTKVLIVDDHPLVLSALSNLLTAMEYDVISTASSEKEVDAFLRIQRSFLRLFLWMFPLMVTMNVALN
jgi:DNA-binding NarL/FixJ family response regulator